MKVRSCKGSVLHGRLSLYTTATSSPTVSRIILCAVLAYRGRKEHSNGRLFNSLQISCSFQRHQLLDAEH